ncbi:MAG: YifB family Mg chelatase-like AAA ATPase [Acidimicrobiales bacterium]
MHASIASAIVVGASGQPIMVEAQSGSGLPKVNLVGLADNAVRESLFRIKAALESSHYGWPLRYFTVDLVPSGVKKHGTGLDVPIALAILKSAELLNSADLTSVGAAGELGLDGSLRAVDGMIAIAGSIEADTIFVPASCAAEAAAAQPGKVIGVETLTELVEILVKTRPRPAPAVARPRQRTNDTGGPDLADVRGQFIARFGLEVAAAGGHHLLMVGPPGAGKTMLAARLPGLLPDLSHDDALTVTQIHSAAGHPVPDGGLLERPPFRAPHHGMSSAALVGGGSERLRPGEISCSHGGVLFLDELGEFPVSVLEALRQPLEEGVIRVARAAHTATMPARFQLVGAMNPCPCGQGGTDGSCRCSDSARARYARKLSGPLLDRFDLRIELEPPDPYLLLERTPSESSAVVRSRVAVARERAAERGYVTNSAIPATMLDALAPLSTEAEALLQSRLLGGQLTGRGLRRIRAVALTVADLAGHEGPLSAEVVAQALTLRAIPHSVLGGAA